MKSFHWSIRDEEFSLVNKGRRVFIGLQGMESFHSSKGWKIFIGLQEKESFHW